MPLTYTIISEHNYKCEHVVKKTRNLSNMLVIQKEKIDDNSHPLVHILLDSQITLHNAM